MRLSVLCLPAIVIGGLVACKNSGTLGTIESAADLRDFCDDNQPENMFFDVFFPATINGCDWGKNDNWEATSGVVAARSEQTVSLEVPDGGVICGLGFDFQGVDPSFQQELWYDDHFLLNFNDAVLAASYGDMVDRFTVENGLAIYSWEELQGFPIDLHGNIADYCLGEDEGASECTIPLSEDTDVISLSFGGTLVDQLSFRALEDETYTFQLVTTGDDNDTDCYHDDFQFTVAAPVVVQ